MRNLGSKKVVEDGHSPHFRLPHLGLNAFRIATGEDGPTLFMPRSFSNEQGVRHQIQMLCRLTLAPLGATVVKAAALSHRGRGILICGVRASGKTSEALLPLFDPEFHFMSDDSTIIHKSGTIMWLSKALVCA